MFLQQVARAFQHSLEGSQAPVVVLLWGQQFPGHIEDCHKLPAQTLGVLEALAEQDDFSDEFVVGLGHGNRTEQLLKVVWKLLAASVALASRVQGYEDAGIKVNRHLRREEFCNDIYEANFFYV